MRTIIVPTDFSDNSLFAAYYAVDLAAMIGARLNLLHVYTIPIRLPEIPVTYDITKIEADANEQLNKLKERLSTRLGSRVNIQTAIRSGEVMIKITEYCNEIKPYAVIMGAESTGPLERFLSRGKTLSAVKRLSWPLLIVPSFTRFKNIHKIGLACDFRNVAESLRVKEIKDLVAEFKAELHILYITNESGNSFAPETVEEAGLLREMFADLQPKYHFLNEPEIEKGINDFAEKNKLDLLIIVPKKHNLADRIFNHSHSQRLVLKAHVPVLSLHE